MIGHHSCSPCFGFGVWGLGLGFWVAQSWVPACDRTVRLSVSLSLWFSVLEDHKRALVPHQRAVAYVSLCLSVPLSLSATLSTHARVQARSRLAARCRPKSWQAILECIGHRVWGMGLRGLESQRFRVQWCWRLRSLARCPGSLAL